MTELPHDMGGHGAVKVEKRSARTEVFHRSGFTYSAIKLKLFHIGSDTPRSAYHPVNSLIDKLSDLLKDTFSLSLMARMSAPSIRPDELGMYEGGLRAMATFGFADVPGNSRIPRFVLNAAYFVSLTSGQGVHGWPHVATGSVSPIFGIMKMSRHELGCSSEKSVGC
jgi:hypothetical protein